MIQAIAEPIRLLIIFATLDRCLIGKDEQQATKWLLPSRSLPPSIPSQNVLVESNMNIKFYPSFRGHWILEWQTCNKVRRSKVDIGTQVLDPEMQSLLKLWKERFIKIDPFSYPTWDTIHEEEQHVFNVYGADRLAIQSLPPWHIAAPNPNNIIFEHLPPKRKVYPLGTIIWKSREASYANTPFSTSMDLQQLMGLLCTFSVVLPWDHF